MNKLYCSPRGYWKGIGGIQKLATAAKVSKDVAKDCLKNQVMWQIYLPAPRYIPRKRFDIFTMNEAHQADLLFLPHDKVRRKTYKYALIVVDVASRYKEAEPLTLKDSTEVANALGSLTKLLTKQDVEIRRREKEAHRSQAIVERFNRTLAERLFDYQYWIKIKSEQLRSTVWVTQLSAVVSALNNELTRLIRKKPSDAIKMRGKEQKLLDREGEPILYYVKDGQGRAFVRKELLIVPNDTVLLP